MATTSKYGFPLPPDNSRIAQFPKHLRDQSQQLEDLLPGAMDQAAKVYVPGEVARQTAPALADAAAAKTSAATSAQTVQDLTGPWETRLAGLEALGELTPEGVTDGQTSNLIAQEGTLTRAALNAAIDEPRTYTTTQTYDTGNGAAPIHLDPDASRNWNSRSEVAAIGPDLILRRHDGNAGQRLALTGRPGMTPEIMPYYEVVAATRTGSDGGAAVAGYQLHLGPDDGAGNNREFFYIEAAGENSPHGPHFRLGEHASGTGERRPLRIETGGTASFIFDPARTDIQVMKKLTSSNGLSLVLDGSRTGGNQTIVRSVVYADGGGASGAVFLGHNGGTEAAPTAPGAGWTLGTIQLGAMNGTTQAPGAQFRALTSEAWTFGTAQGTRAEIHITPKGSITQTEGMRIEDPQSSNQVGLMVRVNRNGTKALSQVYIGPADSAGTGYRTLLVAN